MVPGDVYSPERVEQFPDDLIIVLCHINIMTNDVYFRHS